MSGQYWDITSYNASNDNVCTKLFTGYCQSVRTGEKNRREVWTELVATKRGRNLSKSIMKEGVANELKEFSKLDSQVLLKDIT